MTTMGFSSNRRSIIVGIALIAILVVLPDYLNRRDAKLNIEWSRTPIPEHGRMVTLQHSQDDIQRYVKDENPSRSKNLLIAPQVDIYYEAYFPPGCDKNLVILPCTNSHTSIYDDFLPQLHAMNFCTLTFDWRAHGRSEDTPGDTTSELLTLDAAALIRHVFGNNNGVPKVHVFGWSLGGFVGYQLATFFPELVSSLVVYGSCACFAPIPDTATECKDSRSFAMILFSRAAVARLLGLQSEIALGATFIKMHQPFATNTQKFAYTQRMDQKVKTPPIWLQLQGAKTFSNLHTIQCPFQQMVGSHEHLVTGATMHSMELEAARIPKAEPPILLEDASGRGYSHFALFEEGGLELIVEHLKPFYAKHA
jgi:pimeloyl-ACP methyl ester carboxylesterase